MTDSESSSVPLNIVILPDNNVENRAITHSYGVKRRFHSEFELSGRGLHKAHLSLVHGEYPSREIPTLVTLLEGIAIKTPPFQVEVEEFWVSPQNFLHWKALPNDELMALQKKVVDVASSVGKVLDPGEYRPHITITKLKDPGDTKNVLKFLDGSEHQSFSAEGMSVMDLGNFGTVSTLRADVPFLVQ